MPRDPERIEHTLAQLEATWRKYPDLRLGQLLENVVGDSHDLYNIEDGAIGELLATYPKKPGFR